MTRAEWRRMQAAQAEPDAVASTPAEEAPVEASIAAEAPVEALRVAETPVEVSLAEQVTVAAVAAVVAPALGSRRRLRAENRPAPVSEAELADPFDYAARLFAFTGATPIAHGSAEAVDDAVPAPAASADPEQPSAHAVPRRRAGRLPGRAIAQRVVAASFSVGVMTIVGLLAIGTTTPASAVAAVSDGTADLTVPSTPAAAEPEEIQAYVSSADTTAQALVRAEGYSVSSMADVAAESGVTEFAGTWVNDPASSIQWPFPVGVPISAAYGSSSYLARFSSPHRGVDLTPGLGAEVHVIADGTVRIATEAGGDYGVTVVVDHVVDGKPVATRYAHMQYGSLRVTQGEKVSVGDVLGLVGQTGKATGPHLHFEVLLGGTTHTDPIAWMYAHTRGDHTVG